MSSYEFWDELGKIFNAVVAYQEKNIEFNKRFISPWIRLGNVFEKQDRNKEAIGAYERAIELDASNPRNWFELGNIHFKMENHGEAIRAFNQAVELDPEFGLAYSNLALSLVSTGETERAVDLYEKAIGLLEDATDKAVAWNRLGNAHRKLNQYEQALDAFHKADELDQENSGFRDSMDDVASGPTVEQAGAGETEDDAQAVSPIGLIVAESQAEEEATQAAHAEGAALEVETASIEGSAEATKVEAGSTEITSPAAIDVADAETGSEAAHEAEPDSELPEPVSEVEPAAEEVAAADAEDNLATEAVAAQEQELASTVETMNQEPESSNKAMEEAAASEDAGAVATHESESDATAELPEETVTVVVQDSTETFTETLPIPGAIWETTEGTDPSEDERGESGPRAMAEPDVVTAANKEDPEPIAVPEPESVRQEAADEGAPQAEIKSETSGADPMPNSLADQLLEAEPEVLDIPQHVAYEEYLKDANEPMQSFDAEEAEATETPGSPEPVSKIDESGDLQIEMDTKNAHVWNELGNVYYNSQAYDDAIVAYSKAIELDRWFAWPYSNLALAYVQKRRFVEAILLYQRSIELFSNDKDKAISWNRLGNVYRRLNDYENAIASYQRADALDPDNSTLSLQSRFSLLGSYAAEQKPSYVS